MSRVMLAKAGSKIFNSVHPAMLWVCLQLILALIQIVVSYSLPHISPKHALINPSATKTDQYHHDYGECAKGQNWLCLLYTSPSPRDRG
eukprot:5689565-Amphidinium_carterae.1